MGEKVAVIILAYNDPLNIRRVLLSLANSKQTGFSLSAYVVDNSTIKSDRESIERLVKHHQRWAMYSPQAKNTGFAGGMNRGMKLALEDGADYLFLLNSDTAVRQNTIGQLLRSQKETGAAIIAPLVVYGDRPRIVWYAGGKVISWLGIVRHPRRNKPYRPNDRRRQVSFINGTAMLLPKETIKQYGNLYEPYFMYYEETDWDARIIRQGGSLWYEPRVLVLHFTPSTDDKSVNSVYYLTRNHWLYLNRNISWWWQITARPAIVAFQLYRFIKYLRQPEFREAIISAWRDTLKGKYGPR